MNRIFLAIVLAVFSMMASAQFESKGEYKLKYVPTNDPQYFWDQYEVKKAKVVVDKDKLTLESKQEGLRVITHAEFDFNPGTQDFIFEYVFKPSDLDDEKPFGIVFDFNNEDNYSLITFSEKGFVYQVCEKGEFSIVKRGTYKRSSNKRLFEGEEYASELKSILKDKDMFDVTIVKEQGKFYLLVNNVEIAVFRNIKIENPNFGFYIGTKMKLDAYCVLYSTIYHGDDDDEEE